jgi:hypothetical protein
MRFAILSWGSDPQLHMSSEIRQYWSDLEAALIAVVPTTQMNNYRGSILPGTSLLGDADGVLHEWFAEQEADGSIVLLRPDRVVAGIVQPQLLDQASRTLCAVVGGRLPSARAPSEPTREELSSRRHPEAHFEEGSAS